VVGPHEDSYLPISKGDMIVKKMHKLQYFVSVYLPVYSCDLMFFYYVGFEVVIAVTMKCMVFWFVTLCSSVEVQ
jgi:hypothetical protein